MTAREIQDVARSHGADWVGIASMDRFEGAPKQPDPLFDGWICDRCMPVRKEIFRTGCQRH